MNIEERVRPEALEAIREAIRQAAGNEVLFIGTLDRTKSISRVTVAARGHDTAVAALKPYLDRAEVIVHNHPSGNLIPSNEDLRIAAGLGNQGIGFYIIDNAAGELYVVAEPIGLKEIVPLSSVDLAGILENGGRLSQVFEGYEERSSQVEMLQSICDGFNNSEIRIAEAGTGVGKSLAYLIPAVDWILKNGERVVVSTATINLQQQLIENDIPLVRKLFGRDPAACLVKGRGNYLCLNRLREALEEYSLFEEENEELKALSEWAVTTQTGSRSDLSFYASDDLWSRVCSETDACQGLRCLNREDCFVLKARREAASARLLVANHHLLFSDLSLRLAGMGFESSAVLPPFQHIIFDEAHNVEKSATSFFSEHFSRLDVAKYVSRLFRRKKSRNLGHLIGLEKIMGHNDSIRRIRTTLNTILDNAEALDKISLDILGSEAALRLHPYSMESLPAAGLLDPIKELNGSLVILANLFEDLFAGLKEDEQENSLIYECKLQIRRLLKISRICELFLRFDQNPREIYWLESQRSFRGERYVRFVITPLNIAPVMKEAVYEPYRTVIFTSATLTVSGSFSYWKTRLGIDSSVDREIAEGIFPSSFNYREQVLLGIPSEAPTPDQEGYAEFIAEFIKEILLISEGRALVLFTSYALLRSTYQLIHRELLNRGIPVLQQGEEDRNLLLNRFRSDRSSVLFATDSFWEGVDAPGEALEVVILARLPFRVPTHPVLTARMEAIKERGGNPFLELSLPDAVMRLRQGFGRLIRTKRDKGVVLILDSRIVNRHYGNIFINSLPETRRIISSPKWVVDAVEDFIVSMRKK